MKLEQFFYGRGESGYCVLGASVDSAALSERIVAFCQSVGTPSPEHPDEVEPFLMQRISSELVFMACCRAGASDSLGRPTLLCHVLVAALQDVRKANVSAADLFDSGLFTAWTEDMSVQTLDVDEGALRRTSRRKLPMLDLPAVVRCNRHDNLKVLGLVGPNLVGTDWTTFGWAPQKGCRFQ